MESFMENFARWLDKANAISKCQLQVMEGKRYYRIVKETYAFCFIDKRNGDVLKPAGWEGVAKHARGNIFTDNVGVSEYGALYL